MQEDNAKYRKDLMQYVEKYQSQQKEYEEEKKGY